MILLHAALQGTYFPPPFSACTVSPEFFCHQASSPFQVRQLSKRLSAIVRVASVVEIVRRRMTWNSWPQGSQRLRRKITWHETGETR